MKKQIFLSAALQAVAVAVYLRPSQSTSTVCQADIPVAKDLEERQAWAHIIDEVTPPEWRGELSDPDVVRSADKLAKDNAHGCKEDAYGEVSSSGALKLFRLVNLTADDTFADLGSGLGKLPIQAAVLGGAGHAFGVELSKKRHALACESLNAVVGALRAKLGSEIRRKVNVQLIHGDLFETDLSRVSVIWVQAVCFRRALLNHLGEKFVQEVPESTRVAMTWSEFLYEERGPIFLPSRIVVKEQVRLPMSWTPGYPVHFLQVSGPVM